MKFFDLMHNKVVNMNTFPKKKIFLEAKLKVYKAVSLKFVGNQTCRFRKIIKLWIS